MISIPVIRHDSANHDFYGSTIQAVTLLMLLAANVFLPIPTLVFYLSIIPAAVIAVAKEEVYDKRMGKGTFSYSDMGYTILGALKVYVPTVLAIYLLVN